MQSIIRRALALITAVCILGGIAVCTGAAGNTSADKAIADIAKIMPDMVKNPIVDSVGGEWAVLGLARSGQIVPRSYYENYYNNVVKYVKENSGVLHDKKYTEYSRVILTLTAAGYDPRNVGGYDLTLALGDFEKTVWQGVNGPAFALIALDSAGYDIPLNPDAAVQATRDMYIDNILSRQLPGGGFALSKSDAAADPDMTGMVLQALSKYQDRPEVKTATDEALTCLSSLQDSTGGFSSWGDKSLESVVQVIIALCELSIGVDDPRFVKDGNTLLDCLMDYYIQGKGFEHVLGGGVNQMATEQALGALGAVYRYENGLNSFYDMTDTSLLQPPEKSTSTLGSGLTGKHKDIKAMPVTAAGKTFPDIAGHENKTAIEALASRGIIDGMDNGVFSPNMTMTRAQYAAIVTRALGLTQSPVSTFTDVTQSDWFAGYVGTAYQYGIVNGISAGAFNPNGLITREEAAAMTARAAKLCGMDTEMDGTAARNVLAQFGDYTTVSDWARVPLAFCFNAAILSADDFDIEPKHKVTRCEIAEMLYQMLICSELIEV